MFGSLVKDRAFVHIAFCFITYDLHISVIVTADGAILLLKFQVVGLYFLQINFLLENDLHFHTSVLKFKPILSKQRKYFCDIYYSRKFLQTVCFVALNILTIIET